LRGDSLAALGHAARRPFLAIVDLLGRLASRDGIAHPFNIDAHDAIDP